MERRVHSRPPVEAFENEPTKKEGVKEMRVILLLT